MRRMTQKMKISKSKIIIYFLLFTVIAAMLILVSVESLGGGNIVIKNETDKVIRSLEAVVVDDDINDVGVMFEGKVDANSTVKAKFDKIKLGRLEDAQLYIGIIFEDYEGKIDILEGYITRDFGGNTDIDIYEKDGELYLKAKMGTALFGSTTDTNIDDEYILYPEENDYEYADLVGVTFIGENDDE